MISSQVLAMIRAQTEDYFTETCTIEVEAETRDERGAPTHEWVVVASAVPCVVITAGTQNQSETESVGMQEALVETYRIAVPYGTALDKQQRITVNSDVYQVVNVLMARTNENDAQAVVVRQR